MRWDGHAVILDGVSGLGAPAAASEADEVRAALAGGVSNGAFVGAPPPPAPVATAKQRPTLGAPLSTRDVVRDLKARLRVVEREIKARKTLEAEREQIKRLLAAAKAERTLTKARALRAV